MKKFVLMHVGFEQPSAEIMQAWNEWFASIAERTVENIGFSGGREVSAAGTEELGWDRQSITGCSIIEAESLDEAEQIARACPSISSVRVYQVREMAAG